MKYITSFIRTGILLMPICLSPGCIFIAGGIIANHMVTKSHYDSYVKDTRKDNTEREEHGLKPNQILSFDEWKKGKAQPVNGEAIGSDEPNGTNSINHSPRTKPT